MSQTNSSPLGNNLETFIISRPCCVVNVFSQINYIDPRTSCLPQTFWPGRRIWNAICDLPPKNGRGLSHIWLLWLKNLPIHQMESDCRQNVKEAEDKCMKVNQKKRRIHKTKKKWRIIIIGAEKGSTSVPCSIYSKSGQWAVIYHWVSVLPVSISLCPNRLSITPLGLPVYLSHWPPLWRATGAECSGQPRGQALTRPASKLRQSLLRVELPQAATPSTGVVCSDKKAASWSKHTHTKRKERQKDGVKEKGELEANSGVLSQVSFVWKVTRWFGKTWWCMSLLWALPNALCALCCQCYWIGKKWNRVE